MTAPTAPPQTERAVTFDTLNSRYELRVAAAVTSLVKTESKLHGRFFPVTPQMKVYDVRKVTVDWRGQRTEITPSAFADLLDAGEVAGAPVFTGPRASWRVTEIQRPADADPTAIPLLLDPTQRRMVGVAVHGNTPFDVPYLSPVADNLSMGGCVDGLVLPDHIDHVLSLYRWEAYTVRRPDVTVRTVTMYDSLEGPALEQVRELASYVNTQRARGHVLVHCQAGLNRSGLITAAALVLAGSHPDAAIAHLRAVRSPAVLCNPTFEAIVRGLR